MDPKNKSSFLRLLAISVTALGCAAGLLWSGSATRQVLARSGNKSASSRHQTALRVSDSLEGSRVVLTADQPLNSYEAYRRGDRFYVKIPLSSVPAADAVHGHAFSEVKIEQSFGATIISFRLQTDVTARVDQRGNKIEIVFLVSRMRLARAATANRAAVNSGVRLATHNDGNQSPKARLASKLTTSKTAAAPSARAVIEPASTERNGQPLLSAPVGPANAQKQQAASIKPGLASAAKEPAVGAETAANRESNSAAVTVETRASHWLLPAQVKRLTVGLGTGLLLSVFTLIFLKRRTTRVRAIATEAIRRDGTEVETVVPEVSSTVTFSTSEELQSLPVEEHRAQEPSMPSAIGKLILDNTHRAEVMNSRAPEDRKAIESFLLNIISAAETSDHECRRAREALEQYGFVAQYNATLLKGRSAWERSAAARALGSIGSKSSFPFLIEALNDSDSIVRNEAVSGLAALKDPAAIGALVEASRKHRDLSAPLLSQTLDACSVENLAWVDESSLEETDGGEADPVGTESGRSPQASQGDICDDVVSGWLALVDNLDEASYTQEILDVPVLPQIKRPSYERSYLRVVA